MRFFYGNGVNDHDLSEDVQQRCERSGLPPHTVEVEEHQPGHHAHVGGELVAADSPWVLIHWYKIRLTESSNPSPDIRQICPGLPSVQALTLGKHD